MREALEVSDYLRSRPAPKGADVLCKLQRFAIITYTFDPACLAEVVPDRFKLDTMFLDGEERALVSVVSFTDLDLTSAIYPFPKFRMGRRIAASTSSIRAPARNA